MNNIICKDISKYFEGDGVKTNVLDEINLSLKEGDFVSIVGPSGSGKSTLLSLLGSLDSPSRGEIYFGSQKISELKANVLADFRFNNIGFIFQQFHLVPTLTALENVLAPLFGRRVSFNKKEKAKELLKSVGLEEKVNSLPSQLSGGQQQRVAIARALINDPKWILADEPTGNLDSETGELIFSLISDLNKKKGCGVIFVTHDPSMAERANIKIEMKDGKVISDRVVDHFA
ncbi:ABC transporter ATP-binding protein [[Bacillus] enclensis]|uniref:ABC transporter ATP-binding protein n=1 Tax=[Bacillus] enclensis TaxID=1402860 RepID=UPI0018DC1E5C|nr:ABC transporter ATP-binding protein [[Bacillus] enclensis]MBH9968894.1 ABC transporter ATP-binding protein [[Bacillus] enclensis]